MSVVKASENMRELGQATVDQGMISSSTDRYEVYALAPNTIMEGYVFALYLEGEDVSKGGLPKEGVIVPVDINGRKGYLIHQKLVQQLT